MKADNLKEKILDADSGFTFIFNGKSAGMEPSSFDKKVIYDAWIGEINKDYTNLDTFMNDKFYDGKSITELVNEGIGFYLALTN